MPDSEPEVASIALDAEDIATRVAAVRDAIAAACAQSGRTPDSVTLIAVSKTHPPHLILHAARAGISHFGENRVEESPKIAAVTAEAAGLTWHMIGHVQSRKARDVVGAYQWVHSVDSMKIAERYSRFAVESHSTLNVLLEMNVSGEESKEGFAANTWEHDAAVRAAVSESARGIANLPGLRLRGLMTVAPVAEDPEQVRPVFASLRRLRDALAEVIPASADGTPLPWDTLSMGMTDDFPVAIEEGATQIRVGRAIFGPRERNR